jgi:hypothetical protein
MAMRRILLSAAAGVLGLALTGAGQAQAREGHDHGAYHPSRSYHQDHGRFSRGYDYEGRDHHWSGRVWIPTYHRYHYYDRDLRCYYYWSPQYRCYYPTDYCP